MMNIKKLFLTCLIIMSAPSQAENILTPQIKEDNQLSSHVSTKNMKFQFIGYIPPKQTIDYFSSLPKFYQDDVKIIKKNKINIKYIDMHGM
ncbi:hypothetical protein [Photobacterium kishitanii]|uniref:Uncharacterized protein n=1 Tax=Photobacterium kishitanii TaxID=318456 RepID=A0A2T3KGM0_9GAMM|nr:hypothetical protein [Photobacterium kishitanii]PSU98055.1 hypothetical protein C9J27_13480 [Photobacterium kishitanii]